MRVVCKNLQKEEFIVDCDAKDFLSTLLQMLNEAYGLNAENTTLIYAGQVLLDLNVTLETLKFKEGDWFVLYPKKLKPSDAVKVQGRVLPPTTPKSTKNSNEGVSQTRVTNMSSNVVMSERAINSMLDILRADPRCNQLLAIRPDLEARLRNPQVLRDLAERMGLDLTRFSQNVEGLSNSSNTSEHEQSTSSQEDNNDSQEDNKDRESSGESDNTNSQEDAHEHSSQREVLALPASEIAALTRIRQDLMAILGPLPPHVSELQLNTIIYEAYMAAEKDAEITLNILIDQIMEHDSP